MNHYDKLWIEKYRPQKLADLVLSEDIRKHLENFSDDIPHLLFYGRAGIGKTTIAKILVKDILQCQYLYINASDENGIDTIRNKVISFCQTRSMDGKKKTVILDEFCGVSGAAMRILRNVMEEYIETTRFILTSNSFSKIIDPIRSRCITFNLKPDLKGCIQRCLEILKAENIEIGNNLPTLVAFVKERFPDMRRIVNDLQKSSGSGKLEILSENLVESFASELLEKILKKEDTLTLRKYVIEGESLFDSDYQTLYSTLFNLIFSEKIDDVRKKSIMLELGEFTYRDNFVVDHEINFFCFLLNVENILK